MLLEITNYADFKSAVEQLCVFLHEQKISAQGVFDSKLVVHELLGNVLQHSGGNAKLRAEIVEEFIELSVQAEKSYCPPCEGKCPEPNAERGRGIFLVDRVSAERVYTADGCIVVRIKIK